ncbi:hypothetical protein [Leclercia sp. Marseille-Q4284]|uniref:hypothetical protein n=1 Tax=Leclercia sp. Marseille-Q4284 TaxID=2866582 RepID=UPI001CE3C07E|nr:hypothetical protein [Leclercia sp. Marseille-Q4284]
MAALDPTKEDWAWFEIWQDTGAGVLVFRRSQDPHHRSNVFNAMAYLDANVLEAAVAASETAKDNKVARAALPGAEAVAVSKNTELAKLLNKHTYYLRYTL